MTRNNSGDGDVSKVYIRKHIDKPPKGKRKKGGKGKGKNKTVKVGNIVNISDLLFTHDRDYLIKYNQDNQELQIKDGQLAGKVIVLHFVSLLNNSWKPYATDLMHVYQKLEPTGSFEVVFVAVRDGIPSLDIHESTSSTYSTPQERFQERFSTMPWTAIPFSDLKSRKRLEKKFDIGNTRVDTLSVSCIIDPRGLVLQVNGPHLFSRYGSTAYPFTRARLESLDYQDSVARKQLSITTLLASPQRDYVITNKGDQVPLHKLEDKVVALYFFTNISNNYITSKLKLAYEELCKTMEDFEVVLIDLRFISSDTCEDASWKTFEAMPWLAIPFKDTDCSRKLLRIFESTIRDPGPYPVSKLVIIGPHGKFIEPFGANILSRYGIPAYPFTRFSVVKLKIENVKDVRPEMFWDLDTVFRQQNGSKVQFSQIVGKRIIILFELHFDIPEHTLKKLNALYNQMKGMDDEFEVIHISKAWESRHIGTAIPWVMHPPFDEASNANYVMCRLFGFGCNGLLAFDRGGRIVRMTERPAVGKMVFPFYHAENMENEVLLDVENTLDEFY